MKLTSSLKRILIFFTFLILLSQAKILMFTDISVEPVFKDAFTAVNKAQVYLVSYADGPEIFHKNQNAL